MFKKIIINRSNLTLNKNIIKFLGVMLNIGQGNFLLWFHGQLSEKSI